MSAAWRGAVVLMALLHGCAAAKTSARPSGAASAPTTQSSKPEPEPELVMGFMQPNETLELPAQPAWQGIDCPYPSDWWGPGAGGVALFRVATEAELRSAHPTHRSPGVPGPWPKPAPDQLRAAFLLGAGMAQLHIEGIDGSEVERLPWIADGDASAKLTTVLVGPDADDVQEVPAQIVAKLATVQDFRPIGREWAGRLLDDARKPRPPLTPEQELVLQKLLEKAGATESTQQDPNELASQYRADAWMAVACQLTQLARYAVQNQRRIFLERYID